MIAKKHRTSLLKAIAIYGGFEWIQSRNSSTPSLRSKFRKSIVPFYGHNACMIRYRIRAFDQPIVFVITPLFNHRDHGDVATIDSLPEMMDISPQTLALRGRNQPDSNDFIPCLLGTFRTSKQRNYAGVVLRV
ncbi:MAG: glycogen debranching enzyme N-terminal domain-containing protein [Bacillus subtilis]|nr:glycogen debranching enzyme N-terminal domain-containing protein [Bacillus subtilis]